MSAVSLAFPILQVTPMTAMTPKRRRKQICTTKLPAQEQAVVNEFANVIRQHRDQGLVALARLARVAFEFSLSPKPSRGVAWHGGGRQAARFPRWQFDRHGRLLVGLQVVLGILNRGERLDSWGKVLFFLLPQSSFGHKRPLELLREGRLEDARLAAEAYIA